jgi:hypothetical protein
MTSQTIDDRVQRLSTVSLQRVIEPDVDVAGHVDPDRSPIDRSLLSVAGLDLQLSDQQWLTLAREEVAAIVDAGIRFESLLLAGFGRQLAYVADLTDPRAVYVLHELGEETRHSRLFIRLLDQLQPTARNPFLHGIVAVFDRAVTTFALGRPALFCVMVLAGEEIPDLIQKRAVEHSATDPFFAAVARYHRAEEARHLAYARLILPELWAQASRLERFLVRWVAPVGLATLFDSMVHPGVYKTVGLPGWRTWRAVRRSPARRQLRHTALSPVQRALADAGAFATPTRVPRPWRRLCGTDERHTQVA